MKQRIEEMLDNLKDIRKDGVLSDDYELVDTCNTKIAVLTELLSNAEGEVKEIGIVELGNIASRAVQEVLNQGGRLTSVEQIALTQMLIELGEVFYSKLPSQPQKGERV